MKREIKGCLRVDRTPYLFACVCVFLVAEIWHAHAEAAKSIAGAGELVVGTQTQQPSS
jgi:hypothetical protein